jgi:hypothetical protein
VQSSFLETYEAIEVLIVEKPEGAVSATFMKMG